MVSDRIEGKTSKKDRLLREDGWVEGAETRDEDAHVACAKLIDDRMEAFEKVQFDVLFDLFEISETAAGHIDEDERLSSVGWESLLQVDFFVLSLKEVSKVPNPPRSKHKLYTYTLPKIFKKRADNKRTSKAKHARECRRHEKKASLPSATLYPRVFGEIVSDTKNKRQ